MTFTPDDFTKSIGSMASGVFILYLMVSFNFIPEIFGCEMQNLLKSNYVIKHIVGLLTVFFFINVTTGSLQVNPGYKLLFSIIMYLVFAFSNKSMFQSQLIFIFVISVSYALQLARDQISKSIDEDPLMTEESKKSSLKQSSDMAKAQTALFGLGVGIIIFGHLVYIGKKKLEFFDNEFSYTELLKGTKTGCSNVDKRPYTIWECLKALTQNSSEIIRQEQREIQNFKRRFRSNENELPLQPSVPSGILLWKPSPIQVLRSAQEAAVITKTPIPTLKNLVIGAETEYSDGQKLVAGFESQRLKAGDRFAQAFSNVGDEFKLLLAGDDKGPGGDDDN